MSQIKASSNLPPLPLPDGVTSQYVYCPSSGLKVHYLESGYDPSNQKPLLLLIHGFPELAFSWREVMAPLASAGYHVVAFDQRGYGRTTGWDDSTYTKTDFSQFNYSNLVRDVVVFVAALGHTSVRCVIGHDFGAVTAGYCALMRPDLFTSVITMSHPFKPVPTLPFGLAHSSTSIDSSSESQPADIHKELAQLPEPRKHYKWYNATAVAALQWSVPSQGLKELLRGYFHVKSADYAPNKPHKLESWTAPELAKMPHYYILPLYSSMPEAIANLMRTEDASKTLSWLSDDDLNVYVQEWSRTGFQGGLNWYRVSTDPEKTRDMALFAGKKIECPSFFLSGKSDWGNYQEPGVLEGLGDACRDFRGVKFIEGAGHWVMHEKPKEVVDGVLEFLSGL
ncbi:unnamed protein product [Periconia digitata]|uniref:AB hydrolase-1 domain-containing protein n=1 Tax=Periconia digitata TaxID=1303443 RepID=A0A9W4USN3_9PLEO|nr:unnamed protein product [Periconia digitata]